jgi:16S rRNA (cytosine1402-N4)-methyltransferase
MMATFKHTTVLLNEAVDALLVDSNGFYIDGTFGRGGHSSLILDRLGSSGKLMAVDRDPDAIEAGRARFRNESRLCFRHSEFSRIGELAEEMGWKARVSGVLLDLGVSSPQLDAAERGFSFMQDGPLDMRMNPSAGPSASEWLQTVDFEKLVRVLKEYGEERFARRIATAIVERRTSGPIETTSELAQIIDAAIPVRDPHKHPATRSFQAIRIQINSELDEVREALGDALDLLGVGGRLVVISFHSLEDRLVKRFMRDSARPKPLPKGIPIMESQQERPPLKLVGKAVKPSSEEVAANPRSRSAVMRVAERVA